MKKIILVICCLINFPIIILGQGYNHQWLLGSYNFLADPKGRMFIDSTNYIIVPEFRKMPFKGTQGNICDTNGNFLMSSNGVWIANANNDTMMNGSGLNPGTFANSWPYGLPVPAINLFLNFPNDSSKYILFHQTNSISNSTPSSELFYSTIDMTLDGGLGGLISKNQIVYTDSLSYGIAACKNANGRDWWIVTMRDSSDVINKSLLDNNGNFSNSIQTLGFNPLPGGNVSQLTFSSDGNKFITTTYDNPVDRNCFLVIANFNRCTGLFSNIQTIQLSSGSYLWGLAFSPSGEFAYACTQNEIFQVNTNSLNVDTVAVYDGFISPPSSTCCPSTFWNMYLAANGKIYVTSGSGVRHFTEINYPDSAGIACDVQQHAVSIGNYAHLRAVPNHPNYYLACDTTLGCPCLITGISDLQDHDFHFSVSPNPTEGQIKVVYLLPENQSGMLEVFDITGRKIYAMPLPQWSTLQLADLSFLRNGIYNVMVTSGHSRVTVKVVLMK